LERVGLCLAFANTLHWHASEHPRETLHRYADVLAWASAQQLLAPGQAGSLARRARREPQEADAVYRRATALREAIYRIFVSLCAGATLARHDVERLNLELHRALPHYRVEFAGARARWTLAADSTPLDLPLWPIVQSAAELLLAEDLRSRIGQCADTEGCGWLFLDVSKNRSRRWCSIQECGNRAKQRRLRSRMRARDRSRPGAESRR
jgi:predicted RNA-binding Zn ribbon-like protein